MGQIQAMGDVGMFFARRSVSCNRYSSSFGTFCFPPETLQPFNVARIFSGRSLAHWILARFVQTSCPSLHRQSRDPDLPPRLLCDQARRLCGTRQGHPAVHELCRVSDSFILVVECSELMVYLVSYRRCSVL